MIPSYVFGVLKSLGDGAEGGDLEANSWKRNIKHYISKSGRRLLFLTKHCNTMPFLPSCCQEACQDSSCAKNQRSTDSECQDGALSDDDLVGTTGFPFFSDGGWFAPTNAICVHLRYAGYVCSD